MSDASMLPATDRHQILALSGGGFRGLFTAAFLSHCEETYQAPCVEKFDLIAGTSIGALLSAGLALGVSAERLKATMLEHGPKIFESGPMAFAKRLAIGAPYSIDPLKIAIVAAIGKDAAATPLDQIDAPLLIMAINYTTGRAAKLASRGAAGTSASNITLGDAVLASAAAPTFFPLKKVETDQYVDGGLIANAPDMVALTDTLSTRQSSLDSIYMLSIGTASRRQGAAVHTKVLNPSILSWFFYRGLVQTAMAAQEDLALDQVRALLGDQHLRIDEEPAEAQVSAISSMDKADQRAADTLQSLAMDAFARRKTDRQLRAFF